MLKQLLILPTTNSLLNCPLACSCVNNDCPLCDFSRKIDTFCFHLSSVKRGTFSYCAVHLFRPQNPKTLSSAGLKSKLGKSLEIPVSNLQVYIQNSKLTTAVLKYLILGIYALDPGEVDLDSFLV